MAVIEGTRFLKDFLNVFDATQLSAIRLILIGLGLILLLIFRPQGCFAEYRLKIKKPDAEPRKTQVQTKTSTT